MSYCFAGLASQRLRQSLVLSLMLSALVLGAGCGPTPSTAEPPATTDNAPSTPTTTETPMADPCPTYGPGNQLVDHVIELRAGRTAELGLAAGDEVVIRQLGE